MEDASQYAWYTDLVPQPGAGTAALLYVARRDPDIAKKTVKHCIGKE